jgi:8-oxo-dGTP diphosphatase
MINVSCAVIYHLEKVLIAQKSIGSDAGLWEFPGGKCHDNETIQQCAVREVCEELGLEVIAGDVIFINKIETTKYGSVNLHFIECSCTETRTSPSEHSNIKWLKINELNNFDFVLGDRPFVKWISSIES